MNEVKNKAVQFAGGAQGHDYLRGISFVKHSYKSTDNPAFALAMTEEQAKRIVAMFGQQGIAAKVIDKVYK